MNSMQIIFRRLAVAGAAVSGAALFFLFSVLTGPRATGQPPSSGADSSPFNFAGEEIVYTVKLGAVSVGRATFNYRGLQNLKGQEACLMTFYTQLARFKDMERIYSDPRTLLPLRVERDINIWPRREKIVEEYDQETFSLRVTKHEGKDPQTTSLRKKAPIHNAVLLPFYVRHVQGLSAGWSFTAELPQQQFVIKLVAIEDVKVPAGTFKAYHFESTPKKFEIWITADERRIPVKLTGTGGVGYTMVMRDYRTGAD